ncbi:GNAT family N-acetyltransferase [Paracidobacterium acidisoli]|uniref:N-acetyltransferase n=1 Tax=Paracidobacterium acidisoli TaxID=2303751 RepID=A0A372IQ48_9BACT|nr:GNAT family N-acetyltransferase [Paracidobacterium acidisoli]MBT9330964.1 GNAT family N-acetyltransferase [Paracidobacterium acidisoli]
MKTEPHSGASHSSTQSCSSADALQLRTFRPGDETAFRELNVAWITRHFRLEEADLQILGDPRTHILDRGGEICIAQIEGRIVGCCALLPIASGEFEVGKMAVAEEMRGRGIGRRMLLFTIAHARKIGAHRLYLESSSRLPSALHIYEAAGFRHLSPAQRKPSKYDRADVFMELLLTPSADTPVWPVDRYK